MDTCPKCHRKLLSHTSANCNWCGCKIDDPQYQSNAAGERDAFFYRDRLQQAAEIAQIDMIQPYPVGAYSVWPGYRPTVFAPPISAVPVRRPAGAVAAPPSNEAPDADVPSTEVVPRDPADHIELS